MGLRRIDDLVVVAERIIIFIIKDRNSKFNKNMSFLIYATII